MWGTCTRNITNLLDMCLVVTSQGNGSYPFNVPDMFLPVSRYPCPQWELTATLYDKQWVVQGLLSCLEQVEVRQELTPGRLAVMNLTPVVVNLTQEEDEGGLGSPIFLAPEILVASVDVDEERERAQQELIDKLDHLLASFVNVEETTSRSTLQPGLLPGSKCPAVFLVQVRFMLY